MSLEADVAYLHLIDGIRQTEVPEGLSVHSAPRKAARGRDRDVLLLGLYLNGTGPKDLGDSIVNTYFGTPGSVTAAARTTVMAASAQLYDYNRYPPTSGPVMGGLCLAVLRGTDLYIALSGIGRVLVVHPTAIEHFPDSSADPMSLFGSAKIADIQYFHTQLAASDYAAVAAVIPEGWQTNTLTHLPNGSLESAVARLTRLAGSNAGAMVIKFTAEDIAPAKGRPSLTASTLQPLAQSVPQPAHTLTPSHSPELAPQNLLTPTATEPPLTESAPEPNSEIESESDMSSLADIIARVRASPVLGEPELATETVAPQIGAAPDESVAPPVVPNALATSPTEGVVQIGEHVYEFEEANNGEPDPNAEIESDPVEEGPSLVDRIRGAARGFVARLPLHRTGEVVKQGSDKLGESLSGSSNAALRRVLPEGTIRPNTPMRVPDRMLMAIAILLPIVIAVAVGVVYIQRGRNQQYQDYLDRARVEAGLARVAATTLDAKPHWQTALQWLDQSDRVFPGQPESAALRIEAQAAVDQVDNVQRLNLEPLIPNGLSANAQITEIVVQGNEVYTLDAARQAVYRAIFTESDKYVIDRNFQCQLGVVGAVTIKQIVDIAWLETPNIVGQPALMALDADGDVMYCKTDGTQPEASTLIAPDTGWKTPKAIEIYADRLYVFDPGANDIWSYDRVGGIFSERPKSYFTGQVFDLSNAVNFTIAQGEVYILRNDGRLTYCIRDLATLQTNCIENSLYSDSRPGHASGDRLDDVAGPLALFYDPPPEPSLYLLDTTSSSVYQLSLKLVLQKVYRSATTLPGPILALAIGPNKDVFVSAGNNVYWARR